MKAPFIFGKLALDKNFTNRKSEISRLTLNFISLTNTILVSPRRWGKSSLVVKAAELARKKDKSLRFCFIDLYNVRTEEQFYKLLAKEVLRVTSSKLEELLANAKNFMGQFIPRISLSPESTSDFSLGLDWEEVIKDPDDILNLCEKIANNKKLKIIICIDEFQNISVFSNQMAFQKKLRSNWQKHQNVGYCLYGSKRHMLMDVFTSPSMPFYKFGDLMFLEKISENNWIPFLKKRFADTGKTIDTQNAKYLSQLVECHPYYVQQLAQLTWFRTTKICNENIINEAHENLVLQLSLLFQTRTDELSTTHVNFMRAIINGEKHPSSKYSIETYQMGTSANVIRIKKALIKKEIIDVQNSAYIFLDPVYKYWLEFYYFIS
ncbi:MAG: ATP-binding protein [Prolixibacteraceae bacterium]|jgi:uncharacterized protein|nr:ATP-binding protein [Prolixibacteraceae bacterium]MBT6004776.1 ATP-binding protein [Prolixibacteraceae bacterium]MBT6764282.1 ATP-binding protein [Prolixibacteraceae bacterium]MBT6999250.1 ATP-binding protein [Prolixibacteraceae bacterium]MBT7393267.1 ATP-binding protein [Prolixibacteraceae bacterium]